MNQEHGFASCKNSSFSRTRSARTFKRIKMMGFSPLGLLFTEMCRKHSLRAQERVRAHFQTPVPKGRLNFSLVQMGFSIG